jgi:hypothetical protein
LNALLRRFRSKEEVALPSEELCARFEIRDQFLSEVELGCYRLLCETFGDRAIICPKSRVLASLRVIDAPRYFDDVVRIERKKIDFLVCSSDSSRPLCAVQIDWWNEEQGRYQSRECLLEQAFDRAGLPVTHIPSNRIPNAIEMRKQIEALIDAGLQSRVNDVGQANDAYFSTEQRNPGD